jgi:hypothetical protein
VARDARRRLDGGGAALLAASLLALVLPLTFGRDARWPAWVWPCLAGCTLGFVAFVALERRVRARGGDPLFDLDLLRVPGIAFGVVAVLLVMGCYAGFLLALTLHLQDALGFTPLQAGLTFAAYAGGFAVASLTWTRAGAATRDRLPVVGPCSWAWRCWRWGLWPPPAAGRSPSPCRCCAPPAWATPGRSARSPTA